MERCAATPVLQASGFTEQNNRTDRTEGTNGVRSAVASRLDDGDPDDARWEEVKRVQAARRDWAKKLGISDDDVQVFIDNKLDLEVLLGQSPQNRRNMAAYLRKSSGPMPRWMAISGLVPEVEKGFCIDEEERRKRLRALYKATVLLIKRTLGRHEIDADKAERSVFWDPVAMVARELDIPPSKLSQLLKEFSGHSLTQVIDNCRAAALKGKLRAGVRAFLKGREVGGGLAPTPHPASANGCARRPSPPRGEGKGYGSLCSPDKGAKGEGNARGDCVGVEKEVWAVWGELRKSRKWPEFSPNTWANELGFASYRRLYRACVSVYGKTPYQMEMMLIREELEGTAKEDEGVDWVVGLKGVEEAVRGIRAYCEEGYSENG